MDKKHAAEIMQSRGWLARQPRDFQQEMIGRSMLRQFVEGDVLYHAGDPPSGVFGLVEGVIKIELAVAGATYRVASVRQPGYWTGEGAAFRLSNRLATMKIAAPSHILHLPLAEFEQLIRNPVYCRCFAVLTMEHLEEAITVLGNILAGTPDNRVAARLVMLAERDGRGNAAELPITQYDIAEMCALSRQTVQQVLSRLETRGLLQVGYRRITVPDVQRLAMASAAQGD